MRQSCLFTMLRIKSLDCPHGYQLLGDIGMLTKARVGTTQLLVLSTHGTSTPVCLQCSSVQLLAFCLQRA